METSTGIIIFIIFFFAMLGAVVWISDLSKAQEEKEKQQHIASVSVNFHTYNNTSYSRGEVFTIKAYDSNEIVEAVYLFFNTETQRNHYEEVIGTTVVTCTDEWLDKHLIEFTGETKNINDFHYVKRNYNNFLWSCPMCGSRYVREISSSSKAVSVAAVGVASKKIGKNYKCTKCHYQW